MCTSTPSGVMGGVGGDADVMGGIPIGAQPRRRSCNARAPPPLGVPKPRWAAIPSSRASRSRLPVSDSLLPATAPPVARERRRGSRIRLRCAAPARDEAPERSLSPTAVRPPLAAVLVARLGFPAAMATPALAVSKHSMKKKLTTGKNESSTVATINTKST